MIVSLHRGVGSAQALSIDIKIAPLAVPKIKGLGGDTWNLGSYIRAGLE
jgi:hypothetical protein